MMNCPKGQWSVPGFQSVHHLSLKEKTKQLRKLTFKVIKYIPFRLSNISLSEKKVSALLAGSAFGVTLLSTGWGAAFQPNKLALEKTHKYRNPDRAPRWFCLTHGATRMLCQ